MSRDRRAAGWIAALAIAGAVYALLVLWTGGFETELLGTRIRSRAWERPMIVSSILFLLSIAVSARHSVDGGTAFWARLDSVSTGRWLATAAMVWAVWAGFRYGTFVAGGADSFGYVSQAHLFARGTLTDGIPMRPDFAWRDASLSLVPLAYVPAAQPDRMAPVYPPGLPLLMSLTLPFGERAVYAVVPLLGAVVILCTWAVGRRLGDPLAGGLAAASLSVSATFLLMQFAPMSDMPVTALWLGALLSASANFSGAAALGGALAGVAVLTRPNLAPLALAITVVVVSRHGRRVSRLVMFVLPLLVAVAALLWIQFRRYGDPFMSGYGAAGELFDFAHVTVNLASYTARINAIYTPVIWLSVLGLALAPRIRDRPLLGGALLLIIGVWLAYLPYQPFDAWFFSRFLLPAIPLMLLLAVMVALAGIRRLPVWLRPGVVAVFAVSLASTLWTTSQRLAVFESTSIEKKYPDAGHFVRDDLPASTYVIARQHSGSVRFYSGRPTIRWDVLGPDQLDLVVRTLRTAGSSVHVVLDADELPEFEKHFAGQSTLHQLRVLAQFGQARVYVVE